jgi:hypothetical protein
LKHDAPQKNECVPRAMDVYMQIKTISDISKQLDQEKYINETLRTEAARLSEQHEQEISSLKEALRQIHVRNAHEKWNKLRKAGAHDIVETLHNAEKKRHDIEHQLEEKNAKKKEEIETQKEDVVAATGDGAVSSSAASTTTSLETSLELSNEEGLISTLRTKCRKLNFSLVALKETIEVSVCVYYYISYLFPHTRAHILVLNNDKYICNKDSEYLSLSPPLSLSLI